MATCRRSMSQYALVMCHSFAGSPGVAYLLYDISRRYFLINVTSAVSEFVILLTLCLFCTLRCECIGRYWAADYVPIEFIISDKLYFFRFFHVVYSLCYEVLLSDTMKQLNC